MKSNLALKTKRLRLEPMSNEELQQMIEDTTDEGLKLAYTQMLQGAQGDEDNRIWYVPWTMKDKKLGTLIGTIGFHGPVENDAVEIGYGVKKEFEGQGYTTEAMEAMVPWVLEQEPIFFVEAESEENNIASIKILEKLKFQPDGQGEEGPRFVLEKPATSYLSIYMCIGLSMGVSLGTAMDHLSVGLCLGIAIGVCIGSALDNKAKKAMADAKERRKARLG